MIAVRMRAALHVAARRRRLLLAPLAIALVLLAPFAAPPAPAAAELDQPDDVAAAVGRDLDAYWRQVFVGAGLGERYRTPRAIAWYNSPDQPGTAISACGALPVQNSVYCPADQTIYLDYAFHARLMRRPGGGDYASGLVLAHEWGHHIQAVLGLRGATEPMELQADCFAGAYSRSAAERGLLEAGDLEEAYGALWAAGGGDHGSAAERIGWFRHGFVTGAPGRCTP